MQLCFLWHLWSFGWVFWLQILVVSFRRGLILILPRYYGWETWSGYKGCHRELSCNHRHGEPLGARMGGALGFLQSTQPSLSLGDAQGETSQEQSGAGCSTRSVRGEKMAPTSSSWRYWVHQWSTSLDASETAVASATLLQTQLHLPSLWLEAHHWEMGRGSAWSSKVGRRYDARWYQLHHDAYALRQKMTFWRHRILLEMLKKPNIGVRSTESFERCIWYWAIFLHGIFCLALKLQVDSVETSVSLPASLEQPKMLALVRLLRIFTRKGSLEALPGRMAAHVYMSWQWSRELIRVVVSNIFYVHPEPWGRFLPIWRTRIFFKWVEVQPPTSNDQPASRDRLHCQVMLPCGVRCTHFKWDSPGKGVWKKHFIWQQR